MTDRLGPVREVPQQINETAYQNAKKVGMLGGIEILGIRIKMAFKGEEAKDKSAMEVARHAFNLVKNDNYMQTAVGQLNHMNKRQLAAFSAILDKEGSKELKAKLGKLFAARDGKLEAHQNINAMKTVKPLGFLKSIWHGVSNWRSVAVSMTEISTTKQDTNTEVGKMYARLLAKVVTPKTQQSASESPKIKELRQAVQTKTAQLRTAFLPNLAQFKVTKGQENYNEVVKQLFNTLHTAVILGDPEILAHRMDLSPETETAINELHGALTNLKEQIAREEEAEVQPQAQPSIDVGLYISLLPEEIQRADKDTVKIKLLTSQPAKKEGLESHELPQQTVDKAYEKQIAESLEKSLKAAELIKNVSSSFLKTFNENPETANLNLDQLFDIAFIAANGRFEGSGLTDTLVQFASKFNADIFSSSFADDIEPQALYNQISRLLLEQGARTIAIPTSSESARVKLTITDEPVREKAKVTSEPKRRKQSKYTPEELARIEETGRTRYNLRSGKRRSA